MKVSFTRARFDGESVFKGRSFEWQAIFTDARFYEPPDFNAVTNAARIDFTGAHIGCPAGRATLEKTLDHGPPISGSLACLSQDCGRDKNRDRERDLYIEERMAERGVYWRQLSGLDELEKKLKDIKEQKKHVWLEWRLRRKARNARRRGILAKPATFVRLFADLLWILAMGGYWLFADYGRSFIRPAACWLVLSLIIFPWVNGQILPLPQNAAQLDVSKFEQAVQMVARANAVPFIESLTVDADIKKFLFCGEEAKSNDYHPIPPKCYQWPWSFKTSFRSSSCFSSASPCAIISGLSEGLSQNFARTHALTPRRRQRRRLEGRGRVF